MKEPERSISDVDPVAPPVSRADEQHLQVLAWLSSQLGRRPLAEFLDLVAEAITPQLFDGCEISLWHDPGRATVVTRGHNDEAHAVALDFGSSGSLRGTLRLNARTPRSFAEPVFGQALASLINVAIERDELLEAVRDAHEESAESLERLDIFVESSKLFARTHLNPRSLQRLIVQKITELIADGCIIQQLDGAGRSVVTVAASHDDARVQRRLAEWLDNKTPAPIGETLSRLAAEKRAFFWPRVDETMLREQSTHCDPLLDTAGVGSLLIIPLSAQEQVFAFLYASRDRDHEAFTEEDRALLEDLAERAAMALESARLYEDQIEARKQAEQAAARTARLQTIAGALSTAITPDDVGFVVARQTMDALGAAAGAVLAVSGAECTLLASVGADELLPSPTADASPLVAAAYEKRAFFCEKKGEVSAQFSDQAARGVEALVVVPLMVNDDALGALALAFTAPRAFDANDHVLLQTIALQCAQALERARAFEHERAARWAAETAQTRLTLLGDASIALTSSLDVNVTTSAFAKFVVPNFSDVCIIEVASDENQPTRRAFLRSDGGDPQEFDTEPPPTLESEIDYALILRRDDATSRALLDWLGNNWGLVIPMFVHQRRAGTLWLGRSEEFTIEDLAWSDELGRRMGLAIDNGRLYERAQRAIVARDDFLSIAGHELKTPLTALKLHLHTLARGAARAGNAPNKSGQVEKVLHDVDRMARLIDELLDVSRITAGRLTLQRETVDLLSIIHDVIERLSDELARNKCELSLQAPRPLIGEWDRARLEQVFTNLLTNAMKYGRGNAIDVKATIAGDAAQVIVRDYGIGIAPEDQARIFQRFERAVSSRHYGGLGLGLWIVREIIEAHHGQIEVESKLGEGAAFIVRLPFAPPATP